MKIAVCVKWVPVVSRLRFDAETKRIVRDGVPSELNGYDVLSVQRAVELKASHGAEVSVYTMGPPNARDGLVRSLAMGAERAFHIVDAAFAGADTLATSRALALALAKESYDLILFGNFSLDAETGQVGPEVAEFLGLPQITAVAALDLVPNPGGAKPGSVAEFTVRAERLLEDGTEVVEADLPVVVSVAEGIAPETFPGRDAIREAAEREITEITAADLAADHAIFGAAGSPTSVAEIRIIESEREQRVIEDTEVGEAAKQVVAFLRERGALDPARRPGARERRSRPPAPPTVRGPGGPQTWVVAELGRDGVRAVTHELLAAAQQLGSDSFVPAKRNELPDEVQTLIESAKSNLNEALAKWQPLHDPEPEREDQNFKHPETGDEYNFRAAETWQILQDLAGGILTKYPLQPSQAAPGGKDVQESMSWDDIDRWGNTLTPDKKRLVSFLHDSFRSNER
ncbi:MAG: electron transfer flavoprotein subunit beta/FixA family protein, partial [Chloroflexi bacterium]|nr:electron transfer flavoprotein subunit beta/FixA family protein [Chloroflexota bacterium]